jgi:trans-2,3-dihydro-3-hydroxyanthranilate isomerase
MGRHRLTYLDVFTDRPLAGNQLAVVHDADGVEETTMLAFARETKFSETTFVQTSARDEADYRNRIWDLHEELPFAGHPSLGTAVAVAVARGADAATLRQETPAGVQPIEVERRGERSWRASMLQEPPEFGPELDAGEVASAIGLGADDAAPGLPPQIVSTGVAQLVFCVADPDALARARPDHPAIARLLDPHGAITLYAALPDGSRARSFTGSTEMGEDPATGSAAGPLCAYLAERTGRSAIEIAQGVEMGRPSRLEARIHGDRVSVGGDAVVVAEATLWL